MGVRGIALSVALAVICAIDAHAGGAPRCRGNPHLAGDCFEVHGRLATKNGGPALPLWIIGTHRMLGVLCPANSEAGCAALPHNAAFIADQLPGEIQTFGDFMVCPFAKPRPGWMQFVCVEEASNLVVERWDDRSRSWRYVIGPADSIPDSSLKERRP